jgi:RNA polymerase sigma factor (sigma-70 family)
MITIPQVLNLSSVDDYKEDGPEVVPSGRVQVQSLVEDNGGELRDVFPFILSLVQRVKKSNNVEGISHEEIVSVALAALAKCRYKLKPQRGNKLTTYAYLAVKGALQDFIAGELRHYGKTSVVNPTVFHKLQAPNHFEEKFSNEQLFERVLKALERIEPLKAYIIRKHFLDGVQEYVLARELEITTQNLSLIRKEAFRDIRAIVGASKTGAGPWVANSDN